MRDRNEPDASDQPANYPAPSRAWYAVVLLTLIHMVAFIDRYLMSLLIEPIKASLDLSDFQIGLLIGPAFVFLFVALGIPIGWLADRRSRRSILASGIAIWSLMTAACALASSFGTLFLARIGVGIGEASAAPCSVSLISDYFPPAKRPRAISFWMMGALLGAGGTYLLGGAAVGFIAGLPPISLPIIGVLESWQTAFLFVGLPGLALALLLRTSVREPVRQQLGDGRTGSASEAWGHFRSSWRAYCALFAGIIGLTAIGAASFWTPALFERTWGWGVGRTGFAVGLVLIATGIIGTNLGGWLAGRWAGRGVAHAPYSTVILGASLVLPGFALFPLMPTPALAIAMLVVGWTGNSFASGTSPSALIAITPASIRGQMTGVFWVVVSLFGSLLGPPTVGFFSDRIGGPDALRYGLSLTVLLFGSLMLASLWLGRKTFRACAADQARETGALDS